MTPQGALGDGPPTRGRRPAPRPASEPPSVLRRIGYFAGLFVIGVLLLSLIAAGIGYVRLLRGPISLNVFSETIAKSINAELDGFTAQVDDAQFTLTDGYRLELHLTNLTISEADGDLVASAPAAEVVLDKAALWRLEVAPERVFLIEPRVAVVYTESQGFTLSIVDAPQKVEGQPDGTPSIVPPKPVPAHPPVASPDGTSLPPSFHRVDLARILAESSARARRGGAATSRIREIGVRNAIVSFTYGGATREITLEHASVDLEHMKRRSVISGSATVASAGKRPWTMSFHTEDSERRDMVKLTTTVEHFVPSTLAGISPSLDLLELVDTPLSGQLRLDLSNSGELRSGDLALDVGSGFIRLPQLANTPLRVDGGQIGMTYDAAAQKLQLSRSNLTWGNSNVVLEGELQGDTSSADEPQWNFAVRAIEGVLAAEEFGVIPVPIDSFNATGRIIASEGLIQLAGLSLKAGGGEVSLNGEIISGGDVPSTRIEAALSPMPLDTLKAMWPRAAAPTARSWVGTQVSQANLKSASLKLLSGRFLEAETAADGTPPPTGQERLSASIEISDLRMMPLPGSLPLEAPQALIRLEDSALEVTVPEAAILAGPDHRIPLKNARLTAVDVRHEAPIAELAFKSDTTLPALVEALNQSQLHLAGQGPLPFEGIQGKVAGELKIAMPLVSGANVIKAEGKARVADIKGKIAAYGLDLQGGTVDIDVSDVGVIAKGDVSINGVVAKLHVHRILDAPAELQPPMRISAVLDNADRLQLGLDFNNLVQGDLAAEVTVATKTEGPAAIHVRADLTNSELIIEELAWRKLPGRQASAEFDIETTTPGRMDLKNFKVVGDMIAVDGWLAIDDKRNLLEYAFPNFSLNVVSRLDVRGKVGADKIWKVAVKGSTFDARDMFRSLLALGRPADVDLKPVNPPVGIDLTLDIDTVLGHSDVSLKNYKMKLSERADQIRSIEGQGVLPGGHPLAVLMKPDGPRVLFADSTDAGQTFKLVGFYPNLQGGRMRLEVDLEGRGAAEKSGTLWVEDFRVLGDAIISEVYSSVEGSGPGDGTRKRQVEREEFEFQRMVAPFSVGHGQFVLDDSYIRGPLLGASIRGKVDYNARRINLGGTYVPLQGINSALCEIPLFGPIVSGFDCQGVFGITYAIQGSMAQPQVLVNPLSMFTPGILRSIMEMTSPNPRVQPLGERQRPPAEKRARASSSPAGGDIVDGWSSETMPSGSKKPTKK